jgi:hypothetical protein
MRLRFLSFGYGCVFLPIARKNRDKLMLKNVTIAKESDGAASYLALATIILEFIATPAWLRIP